MTISAALHRGFIALALLLPFQPALAQGARYPEKPVRVLVGYAPGGLPDTVARIVSQKMGERWGQQAVKISGATAD